MANLQFNGFGANMFLPSFGSDAIEAVTQKLVTDQINIDSITLTQIQISTTGGFPSGSFTLTYIANFAVIENSIITSLKIDARGDILDTDGDHIEVSGINQTLGSFVATGLAKGPYGGNDNITGSGSYHEILRGMGGNDMLSGGGDGGDILFGDAGNDWLIGTGGPFGGVKINQLFGGTGNDIYSIFWDGDILKELPNQGIDTVETFVSYTLGANFENLTLVFTVNNNGVIDGTGNELANVITGTIGANVLSGMGGNDTLNADAGNDTLDGGTGNDAMSGGAGNDTYVVDSVLDKVSETLVGVAGGTDTVESSIAYTLGANVENLTLTGSANINGTGNTLANALTGNDGNNVLIGGAGNDILVGGAGNDTLDGGLGVDALSGGLGDDTYVLDNAFDTVTENASEGNDTVRLVLGRNVDLHTDFLNVENVTLVGAGVFNLTGNDENNILIGNASANTLIGGDGNDTLDGGLGNDTLDGGDGNDTYVLSAAGDTIIDSSGNDTVSAAFSLDLLTRPGMENITLLGTAAISATGDAGVNILTGNAGANRLDGGAGADTMIGGAGNDTYIVDNDGDTAIETLAGAAGGIDTVQISVNYTLGANLENLVLAPGALFTNGSGNELANVLTGNNSDNQLSGMAGNDTINAGAGNDRLDGGEGADIMNGGAGNDVYVVENAGDKVNEALNAGEDTVEAVITYTLGANIEALTLIGNANINGTGNSLNNVLIGNQSNNVLNGGAGNDTVDGLSGDDTLDGGTGSDSLIGGNGNDTFVYDGTDTIHEEIGSGNDTVRIAYNTAVAATIVLGSGNFANIENLTVTGTGVFNLTGNDENNILIGNASANTLIGGDGNDTLDGGLGNDTLNGGAGDDIYILNGADIIAVDDSGNDTVRSALAFSIATRGDLENITLLGTAAISATGNDLDNTLTGNAAANVLTGGLGNDILDGGAGNDTLNGGQGNDTMTGGAGNDTYVVDSGSDIVSESLAGAAGGTDLVRASVDFTLGVNLENLTLTGTGDLDGTGNELANVITGTIGANVLSGMGGNDTLNADAGNDTLDGGTGNDIMTGGLGDDTYVVDAALDKVIEALNGGADLVQSSVTHTLALNVENLTLTGSANINGTGNTLANALTGNDGNNVLIGGAGNDILVGGAGNDTLDGGLGVDALSGGLGDDTYVLDNAFDTVTENASEGNDTVRLVLGRNVDLHTDFLNVENVTLVGAGVFNLTGNDENNILIGNASANTLIGGDGNDTLDGGLGNDTLDGGDGNDTYVLSAAGDTIIDSSGNDTVSAAFSLDLLTRPGMENITLLGTAAISATGDAGVNILTGNAGANRLDGGAGADTMIGGAGNDIYVIDDAGDSVTELPGGGLDTVITSINLDDPLADNVENLTLSAGAGNIDGAGNGLNNVILGNSGNNRLDGKEGGDTMTGGAGDDTYVVDSVLDKVSETIAGAAGGTDTVESSITHTLVANVENLTLTGLANINATGNTLANVLTGNAGNNVLNGGAGADAMTGGLGDDTYVIDNLLDTVTEAADAGNDTILIGRTVDLADFANIENVTLTGTGAFNATGDGENNILVGNAAANILIGGNGNDTLNGSAGNDTLNGGAGNDTLDGGLGNDNMTGGIGDDTYYINSVGDIYNENSGEGTDTIVSPFNTFALTIGLENLTLTGTAIFGTGNASANTITGNAAANFLYGLDGNDILIGNDGDDLLNGGNGDDSLSGGIGNDTLAGGAGNDVLIGGTGTNTLMGGTGDDTYIFASPTDVILELVDEGTDTLQSAFSLTDIPTFVEIVQLTGDADLSVTGNSFDNRLIGNDGNNILNGGAGNDTLDGGNGTDTMIGGLGDDTFVFRNDLGDAIVELINQGSDTIRIDRDVDLSTEFANIENVQLTGSNPLKATGSDVDNKLTGNSGANVLDGGAGNDTLDGSADNDTLFGGDGDDRFIFDAADTSVSGGSGKDTLVISGSGHTLNLVGVAGTVYKGIEVIDLTGDGGNNLLFDRQSVLDLSDTSDTLFIRGSYSEYVTNLNVPAETWTAQGQETIDGVQYGHFTSGSAELFVENSGLFVNF